MDFPTVTKRVRACVVGQSNEAGRARTFDNVTAEPAISVFGPPAVDPISPYAGGFGGSPWPFLVDSVYLATGIWLDMTNTAVSSTGLVKDWCGDTVGDGTGVPYGSGDGGFDPNSYLSTALTNLDKGNFEEYWVFIASGQDDSSDDVSQANWTLAIQNITDYFLAQTVNGETPKVAIGMSIAYPTNDTWYSTKGSPAVAGAIASYSGNSNVIAGGNSYTGVGKYPETYDGIHATTKTNKLVAEVWKDALVEAGW